MLCTEYELESCFYDVDEFEVEAESQITKAYDAISTYFSGRLLCDVATAENINICINTTLMNAVTEVYNILGPDPIEEKVLVERNGDIYSSVKKVLSVLEECSNLKIREEFVPGILLLHFYYCNE